MQNNHETLSTIVDGELGSVDSQTLATIASDENSRSTWARYHLIGDVMRDNLTGVASPIFSEQLRAAVEREPTVLAPQRTKRQWLTPVAGFAVAASVATLAVIGIKQIEPSSPDAADEVAIVAAAPNHNVAALPVQSVAQSPDVVDAVPATHDTQRRLNGYLVKFNEQRSSLGVPGVNPYVRIVGFEYE
jgi:sigma-E factor negative regulatory protein RseA